MNKRVGTVYLVGAGPGAWDLITLRGADLLARADAVVYDRLVHPDLLARARRGARLIYAGKEAGGDSVPQDQINGLLIAQARLGRTVVRLKGGDPFVFGRGGEEAMALARAGVPCEVVPGVSSGLAGPALAGIPLTQRGVAGSVTFATGRRAQGEPDWEHLARAETLVLFMAAGRLDKTIRALVGAGRSPSTPAAIIASASLADERIAHGTLGDIALRAREAEIDSPALLVVGEVVALRNQVVRDESDLPIPVPPALTRGALR